MVICGSNQGIKISDFMKKRVFLRRNTMFLVFIYSVLINLTRKVFYRESICAEVPNKWLIVTNYVLGIKALHRLQNLPDINLFQYLWSIVRTRRRNIADVYQKSIFRSQPSKLTDAINQAHRWVLHYIAHRCWKNIDVGYPGVCRAPDHWTLSCHWCTMIQWNDKLNSFAVLTLRRTPVYRRQDSCPITWCSSRIGCYKSPA